MSVIKQLVLYARSTDQASVLMIIFNALCFAAAPNVAYACSPSFCRLYSTVCQQSTKHVLAVHTMSDHIIQLQSASLEHARECLGRGRVHEAHRDSLNPCQ